MFLMLIQMRIGNCNFVLAARFGLAHYRTSRFFSATHSSASSVPAPSDEPPSPNALKKLVNSAVNYYEECLGLVEVHNARSEVNQCEERLYLAQQSRRVKQAEIRQLQNRLKDIHSELDRTQRGEDRYLYLLTEEHAAIKAEKELIAAFEELEEKERDAFNILSNKVRISHEREREREERTKYWSLTGSLVGACLGIIGTTIANEVRMRHIREMIPAGQEIRPLLDEMFQVVREGHNQTLKVSDFLENLQRSLKLESPTLSTLKAAGPELNEVNTEKMIAALKEQNSVILERMTELKRLINLEKALEEADGGKSIVYVGDEMEAMLQQTERNIESKMKLQTLIAVVGFYAAVCVTAPIIYFYFFNK